jgi:hypothetical protein
MVVVEIPFFKSLWDLTVEVCRRAQVPLYVERNDPKIFTTVQKIYLWLYKVKKKLTLRGLVDDLKSSKVVAYLRLSRVPTSSVLSYFGKHLPQRILDMIDDATQAILPAYDAVIIDSTGFECTYPSHYYCRRINSPFLVDGFVTLHAIIDQEHGFVRAHRARAKKIHDSKMLKPLVRKLHRKPELLYADRGYDSEENYRFLREEIDCVPLILQKNILKPLDKCKGDYRREMREIFDYGEYLKRNKIEGEFGGIKKQYGSTVTTKKARTQRKEISIKVLLHNFERKIRMKIRLLIYRLRTFIQNRRELFDEAVFLQNSLMNYYVKRTI